MKTSFLKPFVRGELSLKKILNGREMLPDKILVDSDPYAITVEDIVVGLNKYVKKTFEEIFDWIATIMDFSDCMSFPAHMRYEIQDKVVDEDVLAYAGEKLEAILIDMSENVSMEEVADDIMNLRAGLEDWVKSGGEKIPDEICLIIAGQYDSDTIDSQNRATRQLFKNCLDYCCDELKDAAAIRTRGYCYYCGTDIYPNDWERAKDSFIEYYNMTGDPFAANTLGYIYYYGRCNNGIPQYIEAFKYFSVGHAFSCYESTYKLADMFAHGYGVVKNVHIAYSLYVDVYEENYGHFVKGDVGCKFADAALRIGNCFRDGIAVNADMGSAYHFYLQADYAIRLRMKESNYYGDNVVFERIQKAMAEVREKYTDRHRSVKFAPPVWEKWVLIAHRCCKLRIKELKEGAYALDFTPMKRKDDEGGIKMLITIPPADYCELRTKLRIKTSEHSALITKNQSMEMIFDSIDYDADKKITRFYLYDEPVAELATEYYFFTPPKAK